MHDFVIPELGRDLLCGDYDIARDPGGASVGVDNHMGIFAVNAINSW